MRACFAVASKFGFAAAASVILMPGHVAAQSSGNLLFDGLILDVCILTVTASGTLTPNATYTELSSSNGGGAPGGATAVTTSSNFNLVIDAPVGFSSMPSGGDTSVTYDSSVTASGVTILGGVGAGVLSGLGLGLTNLSIGASATKAAGVFPAGSYQLPVTVRCVSS
ncbi:hypothetical protein [Hyphococcus lacteus]|uniref:Spore coat protein U domain-containing protein n=1 Tax=Hyphococcus lacteus TaxID=3143536 RepID=A0ABV3Z379_9PROT